MQSVTTIISITHGQEVVLIDFGQFDALRHILLGLIFVHDERTDERTDGRTDGQKFLRNDGVALLRSTKLRV